MFLAHVRHHCSCSSCIFTLHPSIVRLVLSTGNLFACQRCRWRDAWLCSEHMRAAGCGLCWAQRQNIFFNSVWMLHTQARRTVSLCDVCGFIWPAHSFITHSRVRAHWPIDHCWCYLCLPWALSFGLFCCRERDATSWPNQKERARQVWGGSNLHQARN